MYRTALAQLHIAAKYSKWENLYSPPTTPTPRKPKHMRFPSSTTTTSQSMISRPIRACKLRVIREKGKSNRGRCLLVFKTFKPGAARNRYEPPCGGTRSHGRRASKSEVQGCQICGLFIDMWIGDLENQVPSLCTSAEQSETESTS
ncbi:hypothetical protein M409DRAFT_28282 [Zasmidium cellare ATCC 36951]|uniref:Uncharacterized protein n=1 Tax=Zasmidium cellare ATCC 36951 TaxID=1080233 RepID=A0A6A6C2T0_ZASCE|nr:uncharacterized protein M409DRAFT_28282 [Zasmidium cellare ATCC 36951]KAF2161243.1 hypothetical protein M409DRAFT_28282 [Zasmidium cellare ATCC 36951]